MDGVSLGSVPQTVNDPARTEEAAGEGSRQPAVGEQFGQAHTSSSEHVCQFPGCGRSFASKRGLGVHVSSAHKAWRDNQLSSQVSVSRAGHLWTQAERIAIAREEIRLMAETPGLPVLALCNSLALVATGRTSEAIKRQRQQEPYQRVLRQEQSVALSSRSSSRPVRSGKANAASATAISANPDLGDNPREEVSRVRGRADPVAVEDWQRELIETFRSTDRLLRVSPTNAPVSVLIKNSDPASWDEVKLEETIRASFSEWVGTLPTVRPEPTRHERRIANKKTKPRVPGEASTQRLDGERPPESSSKQRRRRRKLRRSRRAARRAGLRWQHKSAFQADPYKAAKEILEGKGPFSASVEEQTSVDASTLEEHWGGVFENTEDSSCPDDLTRETEPRVPELGILQPVSLGELKTGLRGIRLSSAPGPDKVNFKALRKANPQELVDWFNLFLLARRPAESLLTGVVTLVPKTPKPRAPSDYRPITVASAILRLFHSILAKRWDKFLKFPVEQRGFRADIDGCLDNTWTLKQLVQFSKRNIERLCLCFCDIRNAFGSVTHLAIERACAHMGVPPPMVEYVRNVYKRFGVTFKGGSARRWVVNRGVLQGDPLSSVAFNCVMALVMSTQRTELGVGELETGEGRLQSYNSYADDTILFGKTRHDIAINFGELQVALAKVGMSLNASKCATFELDKDGKAKKVFTRAESFLTVDNANVPALGERDFYKYLGLKFGAQGTTGFVTPATLQRDLARIGEARIDPQDRLFVLKSVLIPRVHHGLILGNGTGKVLREADRLIRRHARSWLHLPHDTPLGLFHATARDGGLGIPSLATEVPRIRAERMERMLERHLPLVDWLIRVDQRVATSVKKDCLAETIEREDTMFGTRQKARDSWQTQLTSSCDGRGLAIARRCSSGSSMWLTRPNCGISGKEFVKAVHVRCNLLKTPARAGRGGRGSMTCFTCRGSIAGLGHILQRCPSTHGYRVARHDSVARVLSSAIQRGAPERKVVEGPIITSDGRELKRPEKGAMIPDLVINDRGSIIVIDPTIVSDHSSTRDLMNAANRKREKYSCEGLRTWARERLNGGREVKSLDVYGLPITWRGLWLSEHLGPILERLRLNSHIQVLLAIRTLVFGWRTWSAFSQQRTGRH